MISFKKPSLSETVSLRKPIMVMWSSGNYSRYTLCTYTDIFAYTVRISFSSEGLSNIG